MPQGTDNFNRTDENPITGWTKVGTGHDFQVISNELGGAGSASDSIIYHTNTTPSTGAQFSQITAKTLGTNSEWSVACRVGTSTPFNAYLGSAYSLGAVAGQKIVNGVWNTIIATAPAVAVNDIYRIEASGTSISIKKNGSHLSGSPTTDSSLSSGRVGVYMYAVDSRLDDWSGGDLVTEWSLPRDASYDSAQPQTGAGVYQFMLDLSAMGTGQSIRFRIYEKVRAALSQRVIYEANILGPQSVPIWTSPIMILMHGWDATVSDASVSGAVRQVG